ncbi:MAG: 4-diphosphocytidyl-2-C-methyl-D-erythritol kinase [Frankiaceae bacterium]|jgi:4-diphosphocytidyl-2-C-methyl-D-erythritol kinase|nr:4-diphosphocytidyl-2-C-methyl-D-erythritol kinase [Frankiaceae bacterium]
MRGSGTVTVRVPAKVNLHLGIGPIRKDGFHEVVTVYHAVSLYDEVVVAPSEELRVTVVGEGADVVPVDADNLAVRAVHAVAAMLGREPTVDLTLRKGIPVAGGMAGGSADAAATLVAMDQMWSGELDRFTLEGIAAGLGSDVAFLLRGGSALGTGRGEAISPVLGRGDYYWVLAVAEEGLSTAAVYAELDRMRGDGDTRAVGAPDGVLAALRAGDTVALGTVLANDLQAAALKLRPGLQRVLDAGRELGAVGGVVSGSGPTVALLARSSEESVRIASSLAGLGVCRTVRRAHGPVAGARVVPADSTTG